MVKTKNGARQRKTFHKRWVRLAEIVLVLAALGGVGWLVAGDRTSPSASQTPKPGNSQIKVTTVPPGATITVDGKEYKDKSNTTIKAKSGKHTVKLHLDSYDDQTVQLNLITDKPYELDHTFTRGGLTVVNPTAPAGQQNTYRDDQLQTYTNPKYGYSIKYPKDWLEQTDQTGVAHFYNATNAAKARQNPGAELEESLAILVQDNPNQLGPRDWYKSRPEYSQEDQAQIKQQDQTIAGLAAYRYETPYGFVPYTATIFTAGKYAFLLQAQQGAPDRLIYDQLVATFRPA